MTSSRAPAAREHAGESMPASTETPLRFGVMCDGGGLERWQARCVRSLADLPYVEPVALIVDGRSQSSTPWQKIRRLGAGGLGFVLWRDWISRPRAVETVELPGPLTDLPRIECTPELRGRYSEHFSDGDLARIRELDLDFMLRFAFGILRGGILEAARYGVWSFHHGDERHYRGQPPVFWELHDRTPTTGFVLQRLTERLDGGVILKRGRVKTRPGSYAETLSESLLQSAVLPRQVCVDIRHGNAEYLRAPPSRTRAPIRTMPGLRALIVTLVLVVAARIRLRLDDLLRHDHWSIGVVEEPVHELVRPGGWEEAKVDYCPEPADEFLADPFGIPDRSGLTVLCEAYRFRRLQGRISRLTWNPEDGWSSGPEPVLEEAHHHSYPFLFEHDGSVYCVPESHETGRVVLWRLRDGVRRWTPVATLLEDASLLDPTIVRYDSRWWLFASPADDFAANSSLSLWHSSDLRGAWRPHAQNPVKIDVCTARPAGRPFTRGGRLYRPAQDCSEAYGGAVVVNRVDELSAEGFRETVVRTIDPDPGSRYSDGVHTMTPVGDLTLVDGKRRRTELASVPSKIRRRLRNG